MVIGMLRASLALREARSLKDKRRILKSLKEKLKSRFNVSVSEVDNHDFQQSAVLGLAVVAADSAHADSQIRKAMDLISSEAEVVGVSTELINYKADV